MATRFRPNYRQISRTAVVIAQLSCALHLFVTDVGEVRATMGTSMLPTLSGTTNWLLVSPLSYWRPKFLGGNRRPERGDVVTFPSPNNPQYFVCKRVTGLPGDVIEVEPRRDGPNWWGAHETERLGAGVFVKVPKGHVWVTGDNLTNSTDSRTYGPVPIAMIKGKALYKVGCPFLAATNKQVGWGLQKLGRNITELGPSPEPWRT